MKARIDQHEEDSSSGSSFAHFASEFQVNGLKYIGRNDVSKIRKIIWAILLIASFVTMIFHIYLLIQFYLAYPTKLNMEVISTDTLNLPAITVCNENPLRMSKIKELDLMYNTTRNRTIESIVRDSMRYRISPHRDDETFNWTEIVRYASNTRESTIIGCFSGLQNCGTDGFVDMVHANYNFCLLIGGPGTPLLKQYYLGSNGGFYLILNTRQSEYFAPYDMGAGFKISFHERYSYSEAASVGIRTSPGQVTTAYLDKTIIKRQKPPYGECGERELKYFKKYTTANCLAECEIDTALSRCNCTHIIIQGHQMKLCGPTTSMLCVISTGIMEAAWKKSCKCPLECISVNYRVRASSQPYSEHGIGVT